MAPVEPALVTFCILACRIGEPLDKPTFMALALSLIIGTVTKLAVKRWRKQRGYPIDNDATLLSDKYYKQFLGHHETTISLARGRRKDIKRAIWGTFDNIKGMYNSIYELLVMGNLAETLPEPVWCDLEGNIVSEEEAASKKVEHKLTHAERVCMLDETGCNTNQKEDGHIGGQLFITERGTAAEIGSSMTDLHFTTLKVTNA
jgi:hypothetical protein